MNVAQFFLKGFIVTLLDLVLLLGGRRRRRCLLGRHRNLIADLVELFTVRLHVAAQLETQLFGLLTVLLEVVRL